MIGFDQDNNSSNEAAVKYFLLGAFASGFIIYGIALIYGATGSTDYDAIVKAGVLGSTGTVDTLLLGGVALLLVGLGFKISMVPKELLPRLRRFCLQVRRQPFLLY